MQRRPSRGDRRLRLRRGQPDAGPDADRRRRHRRDASAFPTAIILRSRTDRLRFLSAVHRDLSARRSSPSSRPRSSATASRAPSHGRSAAITATMREMAATGDLTRESGCRRRARWEDEDARLLATTFNTMTDSIARFQREAAQRERLSSLGRLSTVVAHEIRNPLMIIKTALRGLRGAERRAGGRQDGGRRHRRGDRPAQPHRVRRARLRPADQVRARDRRPQRALRRCRARR